MRNGKSPAYSEIWFSVILGILSSAAIVPGKPIPEDLPKWEGKKKIVLQRLLSIGGDDLAQPDLVMGGINDIAFDNEGNVFILDFVNYRVSKFSPDGSFLAHFGKGRGQGPGELQFPTGVCADPMGNVYIADFRQRMIHVFDPSNNVVGVIRTEDNIRPIFGMAVTRDMELYAGVDLAFSRWEGGLFQIFSLPAGRYIGSLGDARWFLGHRDVMSGNNCIVIDDTHGMIIISHANPYQIDIFSKKRDLIRSIGRKAEVFETALRDRNQNRIMAGTTVNLALLPNGIITNVYRRFAESPNGMLTERGIDFFNLDGDFLLSASDKEFGIEGPYNLVFEADSKGYLWISYNEPFPHLDKVRIEFRDK